jgi:hypothetical protein
VTAQANIMIECWHRIACVITTGLLAVGIITTVQGQRLAEPTATSEDVYVPKLTFDVASIRRSPPAESVAVVGSFIPHKSVFKATNFGIDQLLYTAYGFDHYYRIVGEPQSLGRETFDIQAKAGDSTDEKLAHLSDEQATLEQRHMLQVLLADRFDLKAHWETKQGEVYNLVVKNGSKLKRASEAPPSADELKIFGKKPVPPLYHRGNRRDGLDTTSHG